MRLPNPIDYVVPSTMSDVIVVTRHRGLVELLREMGIIDERAVIIEHVTDPEQVRGRHVIGVLPMHLAAVTASITEVPLALSQADRGVELTVDRLRQIAGSPVRYVVRRI